VQFPGNPEHLLEFKKKAAKEVPTLLHSFPFSETNLESKTKVCSFFN